MKAQLASIARRFKRELAFYRALKVHPQTPQAAKVLLGIAIGYALLPFDLIPDFLPVIGHLDDAIIIPALIYFALKQVPQELIEECRAQTESQS